MAEKNLEQMAQTLTIDVTDNILKQNLLSFAFFTRSGDVRAFQDLLDFIEEKVVSEVLNIVNPSLFAEFLDIVREKRDEAIED